MSLVSEVVTDRARVFLADPTKTDWPDALLFLWMGDAVQAIINGRADARIDASGDEIVYAKPTALGDTRQLDDRWMEAETHYVCWHAFLDNSGGRFDADRAADHKAEFETLIGTS